MEFEVIQPVTQDHDSTDDELPAPKRRRGVGKEWHVDKTFPDKDAAIAFGHEPEKTISCWAHVVMNMDKQTVRVRDKETRAAIREDIFQLQLCPDEDSFHHAAALFLTKWESSDKDGVASFLEYFQGSWLQRNYTWFEGYAPGFSLYQQWA